MTEDRLIPALPGQVEVALREVHRRRRRTALLGTSTTAAVVALAVALGAAPLGQDALEVTPTEIGPAPSTDSATTGDASADTDSTQQAFAPPPTSSEAQRSASPTSSPGIALPLATASPAPRSSTQAATRPQPGYRRRPPVTRTTKQSYIEPSSGSGRVSEGGCVTSTWCVRGYAYQEFAESRPEHRPVPQPRERSQHPHLRHAAGDRLGHLDAAQPGAVALERRPVLRRP